MGFFSSSPAASQPATGTTGTHAAAARRARESAGSLSIVAKDLTVAGDLQAAGVVRIEGRIIGNVHAGEQVLLCEGGIVEGDIITREAILGGRVHGHVHATDRVEIQATALVHGDIRTERLLIHEGGRVNGAVNMDPGASGAGGAGDWEQGAGPRLMESGA